MLIRVKITWKGGMETIGGARCKNVMELDYNSIHQAYVCSNLYAMYKFLIPNETDLWSVGQYIMNTVHDYQLTKCYQTTFDIGGLKIEAKLI